MGCSLGDLDTHLPQMQAPTHVGEGLASFVEGEDPIDHRLQLMLMDSPVHGLETLPRTHQDTLHMHILHHDRQDIDADAEDVAEGVGLGQVGDPEEALAAELDRDASEEE